MFGTQVGTDMSAFAIGADGNVTTPQTVTVTAPAQQAAGSYMVYISCGGSESDGWVAKLSYILLPTLTSIEAEGGGCLTFSTCTALVKIENPPSTVIDVTSLTVGVTGPSLLPSGLHYIDLMALSSDEMVMRVHLPAAQDNTAFTVSISPTQGISGITASQLSVSGSVTVAAPPTVIRQVQPSMGTTDGGQTVTITAAWFPVQTSRRASAPAAVMFGGLSASDISVMYSDTFSTALVVTVPPGLPAGISTLVVSSGTTSTNAAQFLCSRSGISASCTSGCVSPLIGGIDTEISVSGFGATSSFNVNVGGNAATVSSVSAQVIKLVLPAYSPSVAAPSYDLWATVTSASDSTLTATAKIKYRSPPKVVTSTFDSLGARILFQFDQVTNNKGNMNCGFFFLVAAANVLFGSGAKCTWSGDTLTVSLASGATAIPGSSISLLGDKIKSLDLISGAATDQTITFAAPNVLVPPTISVSGPNVIGSCDSATVIVEGSVGRGAVYSWQSFDSTAVNSIISTETGNSVSVPGSSLVNGIATTISVTVTNFLGAKSTPWTIILTARQSPPPLVSITVSSPPYTKSRSINLMASAQLSACAPPGADAQLTFKWVVSKGSLALPEASASIVATGSQLFIPSGQLEAGQDYNFRCMVVDGTGSTAIASKILTIEAAPLVALIDGGERKLWDKSPDVRFDASPSYDPDQCKEEDATNGVCTSSGLSFAWDCITSSGNKCRNTVTSALVQFPALSYISVDLSAMNLDGETHVELTVSVRSRNRVSQAVSRVSLTVAEVVEVSMTQTKYTATRVAFQGSVTEGAVWSITGGAVTSEGIAALPASAVPTGWGSVDLLFDLTSPELSAMLTGGSSYTVTLSAGANGGSSSISFKIALPPSGGACSASPSVGTELTDQFTLACSGWSAEDLPISYSFGVTRGSAWDDATATWTQEGSSSSFAAYLTAGTFQCAGRAHDFLGRFSRSDTSEVVVSPRTPSARRAAFVNAEEEEFSYQDTLVGKLEKLGQAARVNQVRSIPVEFASFTNPLSLSIPSLPRNRTQPIPHSSEHRHPAPLAHRSDQPCLNQSTQQQQKKQPHKPRRLDAHHQLHSGCGSVVCSRREWRELLPRA